MSEDRQVAVNSFVTHRTKAYQHYDDPPVRIYGTVIGELTDKWIIRWVDGTLSEEPKDQIELVSNAW